MEVNNPLHETFVVVQYIKKTVQPIKLEYSLCLINEAPHLENVLGGWRYGSSIHNVGK